MTTNDRHVVAFTQNSRDEVRYFNGDGRITGALVANAGMKQQAYIAEGCLTTHQPQSKRIYGINGTSPTLQTGSTSGNITSSIFDNSVIRRLTPLECERLQGFPGNFTQIPYRGKSADDCPSSHRYKAMGNSMAVNVMAWIGKSIASALEREVKA